MKKIIIPVAMFSMLSGQLQAGPFWNKLMEAGKYNPANHAMCFYDEEGKLQGENIHKKSYLASITKLVITYVAAKELGATFKHVTKLYYNEKLGELHIVGGLDPIYNKDKLFYLVNQLNNVGITKIKKLTFDQNFSAWSISDSTELAKRRPSRVAASKTIETLKAFLHTPEWEKNIKAYNRFIAGSSKDWLDFLRIEPDPKKLSLSVDKVEAADKASFDIKGEGVKEFHILSNEIEVFLKRMNIYSHNYIADEYYLSVGGKKVVDKVLAEFMQEHFAGYNDTRVGFKEGEPTIEIYNGSGYPLENPRRDSFATCAVTIKIISELDRLLEANGELIQRLVAVTGTDKGTIRKRLTGEQFQNKGVVKTGTTNPVSALAGMLNTNTGKRYFAIFNHRAGGLSAGPLRVLQNKVTRKLMTDFGGGKSFDYDVKKFYPTKDLIIEK